MSVSDFRAMVRGGPGDVQPSSVARGRVARAPTSVDDDLIVVLPDFSMAFPRTIPAGQWQARGMNLPVVNTECVIALDERDDAWLVGWIGTDSFPGAIAGLDSGIRL